MPSSASSSSGYQPRESSKPSGNLTMAHAAKYAWVLFRDRFVQEVWLCGSLAKTPSPGFAQTGGDVDLIAVVSQLSYDVLKKDMKIAIDNQRRPNRYDISIGILGPMTKFWVTQLNHAYADRTEKFPLNLLLLPPDWQERAKELDSESFMGLDAGFIQRIAPGARIFNPETREFE